MINWLRYVLILIFSIFNLIRLHELLEITVNFSLWMKTYFPLILAHSFLDFVHKQPFKTSTANIQKLIEVFELVICI